MQRTSKRQSQLGLPVGLKHVCFGQTVATRRNIQSAKAAPIAYYDAGNKPSIRATARYTPPLNVVIQKLVGQSVT
jgi:hypothetical protein